MNRVKKGVIVLAVTLAAAGVLAGCNKNKETETESVAIMTEPLTEQTEAVTQTASKSNTTKKYISKDKTMSINLPDDTWENKKDADGTLIFEAKGKGTITIEHISNIDTSAVSLPTSEEEVLNNLKEAGKDIQYYEVLKFEEKSTGAKTSAIKTQTEKAETESETNTETESKTSTAENKAYTTVVKCTDALEKYFYTVGYDVVSKSEIYSVNGQVEKEDQELLEQVEEAVTSFVVLKKSTNTIDGQSETKESDKDNESTGETKVIYDSNGNAIYVTKDANGVWKDSNGKTYDMQEYGVMGSDGYWYTYDAPATGSTESSGSSDNNSNDNNNSTSGETKGFYDASGNYITVTKDANGNWVDPYGTVYYFGESGVTDNAGNYHPYTPEGGSNAFYDTNGNYITVTKDANGNWIDSAGTVYYFGDTGVTDASGNFYPY